MEKKWFQNSNWMEIAFDRLQALGEKEMKENGEIS